MKLSIEDYISIKIHKVDLFLTSYIKSKLDGFNLAPEQNLIMMLLWEKDGMTQNDLVERLEKDKTNIARMCSNLEKKGFIKRLHCLDDRRSLRLHLTPSGKELGKTIIPIAEQFNAIVCEGLTNDELCELDRLLSKVKSNVQQQL